MTGLHPWFDAESAGAPEALRARAARYLDAGLGSDDAGQDLALAASQALAVTLATSGDRSVALDLLAADALQTLALKERAVSDPAGLGAFAASLSGSGPRPGD